MQFTFLPLLKIQPNKASMGFNLIELEAAAYSVQEEALVIENFHEMMEGVDKISLNDAGNEK